jgi:hypothetical protein
MENNGPINLFNMVAGFASIISLIVSLFALRQVRKMKNQIKLDYSNKSATQSIKGNKNIQVGGGFNAR